MGGTLAGAVATFSSTVGITGITTHGGNVVSDTDSTDDLGTTGVRWANLWVDAITMGGTLAGAVATFSSTVGITGRTTASGGLSVAIDDSGEIGLDIDPTSSYRAMYIRGTSAVSNILGELNIGSTGASAGTGGLHVTGTIIGLSSLAITGAVSKGSGSFKIDHPLPAKTDTHHLVHSFIEGPQADLVYRGVAALSSGSATVDLDEAAGMTEGTWELLCRDPQVWVQNDSGWGAVRGSVEGNTLTIESKDTVSDDTVSWMVVAERCDQHMIDTDWTDDEGRVIVEPEKPSDGS